jgi:hypothetical protein
MTDGARLERRRRQRPVQPAPIVAGSWSAPLRAVVTRAVTRRPGGLGSAARLLIPRVRDGSGPQEHRKRLERRESDQLKFHHAGDA